MRFFILVALALMVLSLVGCESHKRIKKHHKIKKHHTKEKELLRKQVAKDKPEVKSKFTQRAVKQFGATIMGLGKTLMHKGPVDPPPAQCYAPPLIYGPKCVGPMGIIGSKGTNVYYSVDIIGDTALQCQGLGMGYSQEKEQKFGWYDLGIFNDAVSDGQLYWGASAGTPAMRCKGIPLGSAYMFTDSV